MTFTDLLNTQLSGLLSIPNFLIFVGGLLAIYAVFYIIYKIKRIEYLKPLDGLYSSVEKKILYKFLHYTYWALAQQLIILMPYYFLDVLPHFAYFLSVVIFGCLCHFPNWKLMLFTSVFGSIFYSTWFLFEQQSFVYITILHAFGGTLFYKTGWDMRVWRFKK